MKVTIRNFQKKIPINPKRIKQTILDVLSQEGSEIPGEITVCFVNDRRIKELNFKYLKTNQPTDVLAFDMSKQEASGDMLADIVISIDTAMRNSRLFKTSCLYELNLYIVHGVLHLLGYDDRTSKQKQLMQQKEREYVHTQN